MSLLPRKMIGHHVNTAANAANTPPHHSSGDLSGGDKYSCDVTDHGSSNVKIDFPENVLKIFRPDQTFKFFLVNKETSAREVVMLACREWQESASAREHALFQVGQIRQIPQIGVEIRQNEQ